MQYKRFLALLAFTAGISVIHAQTHMRIHHKGGGHSDVAIEQINSITFVDRSDLPANEGSLVGGWLWGDAEAGYYELLTFNEDKTYTGYDNYFTYGFDTMTYGWYMQMGSMLILYTDGLTEAENSSHALYGEERVLQATAGGAASASRR